MKIELVDDINEVMTSVTDMGEKSKSVVTDDDKNKNDITPPVSEVSSLMSLLSQINMNDPDAGDKLVMAAAKSIEAKCAEQGTPITPFEEFCKQQEEEVLRLQFFAKGELPENLCENDKEVIKAIWEKHS